MMCMYVYAHNLNNDAKLITIFKNKRKFFDQIAIFCNDAVHHYKKLRVLPCTRKSLNAPPLVLSFCSADVVLLYMEHHLNKDL
jgi:hypothetical protein